jgi:hypothetical protein
MMPAKRKRSPKIPPNPLSRPLLGAWLGVLGFVAIATGSDNPHWLNPVILPLVLLLGLITLAWTIQCWRLGSVALVNHVGQTYHYNRKREPVSFHLVMLIYLLGSAGLLVYPAQQLFFR